MMLVLTLWMIHTPPTITDTYRRYQRLKSGGKKAEISGNPEADTNGISTTDIAVSI